MSDADILYGRDVGPIRRMARPPRFAPRRELETPIFSDGEIVQAGPVGFEPELGSNPKAESLILSVRLKPLDHVQ